MAISKIEMLPECEPAPGDLTRLLDKREQAVDSPKARRNLLAATGVALIAALVLPDSFFMRSKIDLEKLTVTESTLTIETESVYSVQIPTNVENVKFYWVADLRPIAASP